MAAERCIQRCWLVRCISCVFAHLRAYAIRPYMFTVCSWWGWFVAFRACSLTSGRMRYAPTCLLIVRRGVGLLHFVLVRAFEGVCDTPLHVYCLFVVGLGRCGSCLFAAVKAYAIRPYMFTVCSWWGWGVAFLVCSLTSGRMRYAPTCLLFVRGGAGALHFGLVRSREGVCDTPLHVYCLFVVGLVRCGSGLFAHVRAYAIRPYMFTVCLSGGWFVAFLACSLT